jgi:hypothetical protein
VQALIEACIEEDGKLYLCVSSPTIKDKPVSGLPHHPSAIIFSPLLSCYCESYQDAPRQRFTASFII